MHSDWTPLKAFPKGVISISLFKLSKYFLMFLWVVTFNIDSGRKKYNFPIFDRQFMALYKMTLKTSVVEISGYSDKRKYGRRTDAG